MNNGRDGKARAAPVPQETREIDYPKILDEETAAHLVKTAQSLAQMILSGDRSYQRLTAWKPCGLRPSACCWAC